MFSRGLGEAFYVLAGNQFWVGGDALVAGSALAGNHSRKQFWIGGDALMAGSGCCCSWPWLLLGRL